MQKNNEFFVEQLINIYKMSLTYHGRHALSEMVVDESNNVHPLVKDLMVVMMMRAPVALHAQQN